MAIFHDDGNADGQALCDALHEQLDKRLGDIHRESTSSCAIWQTDFTRFAYILHKKKSSDIQVYFRADPGFAFTVPDESLTVHTRPEVPEKGWAREFPSYLTLGSLDQVTPTVQFLIDYAVPLAKPKRRKTSVGERKKLRLSEGRRLSVVQTRVERNPKARRICLAHYGATCQGCKQDLTESYGEVASGLIHVHHLSPFADAESERKVDPICDLRPVCPNCHAVIHRRSPPYRLEELAAFIDNAAK